MLVFNTLKSLEKCYDLAIHRGVGFESKGFSSYNSNEFIVLIFIACLSSLCYERNDGILRKWRLE